MQERKQKTLRNPMLNKGLLQKTSKYSKNRYILQFIIDITQVLIKKKGGLTCCKNSLLTT